MSRGNKRKQKKKLDNEQLKVVVENISCSVDINYDKLAEAIVKAQDLAKEQEEKTQKEKKKEWQKSIGMELTNDKKMSFHDFRCIMLFILSFGFNKKLRQKYESDNMIFTLSQTALSIFFKVIQWIGYAFAIKLFFYDGIYIQLFNKEYNNLFFSFFYAFMAFFIAQIFNIASYESFNIKDKNYLMATLSATTCFFSFIVAVISMIFAILSFLSTLGSS